MLCIVNESTNAYFNIASEEYLLKNMEEDCFMLYINEPSIIAGKHQNTIAEINYPFVKEHNIKVVRRLSGGGSVFHDLGNLNFTFIVNGKEGNLIDFRKYTLPIIEILAKLGIEAKFEGRNDLTIDGKKFSGNAEHIWKNRILHHGTLLFSSVMSSLTEALNVNPAKFQDKAVKSIRSRVTNISDHLSAPITVMEFRKMVLDHIVSTNANAQLYKFTDKDTASIQQLTDEKYSTWEWNFGYSPDYNFHKELKTNGGFLEVYLDVNKGFIKNIKFYGDFFCKKNPEVLESILSGIEHKEGTLRETLINVKANEYFHNINIDELVEACF
jgi:lipoate---protein ligase